MWGVPNDGSSFFIFAKILKLFLNPFFWTFVLVLCKCKGEVRIWELLI